MFRKKRLQKKSSKHIYNMKRAIARSTAAADYGSILYLILDSFTDSFSEVVPRIHSVTSLVSGGTIVGSLLQFDGNFS